MSGEDGMRFMALSIVVDDCDNDNQTVSIPLPAPAPVGVAGTSSWCLGRCPRRRSLFFAGT